MLAAIASVALVAVVVVAFARERANVTEVENPVPADVEHDLEFDAIAASDVESLQSRRPNYLYSVIPGGAYSEIELRRAIGNDPIVAAHYRQLEQSKLRVERVARDRYVHVSYRKGNQIFWTKNKVLLRQGETILTDGKTQVRARCGNCISEEPQVPTAKDEPETVEFDRLTDPAQPSDARISEPALVPLSVPSGAPAVGDPAPAAGAPDPLVAGRSLFGGAPLPLAAGTPGGGGSAPSPAAPDEATPTPRDVPPFGPTPGWPGVFPPLPGDELFPLPPGTPTPPGFDIPLPPPGGGPEPPTYFPPSGSPEEPTTPVPVPEPEMLLLVGAGVATALRMLRSRAASSGNHSPR